MLEEKIAVEILIGKTEENNSEINTFALFYKEKLVKYFQVYGGDISETCKEKAETFREIMKSVFVRDYVLINGKTLNSNYEKIDCEKISEENEKIFSEYFNDFIEKKREPKNFGKPRKNLL